MWSTTAGTYDAALGGIYDASDRRQCRFRLSSATTFDVLVTPVAGSAVFDGNLKVDGGAAIGGALDITGNTTTDGSIYDRFGEEVLAVRMESQQFDATFTGGAGIPTTRSHTFTFSDTVDAVTFLFAAQMNLDNGARSSAAPTTSVSISGNQVAVTIRVDQSTNDTIAWSIDIGVKLV